jgi:hypothetical protein
LVLIKQIETQTSILLNVLILTYTTHRKYQLIRGSYGRDRTSLIYKNQCLTPLKLTVLSWRSVLLVEETGILGENHRPVASQGQTVSQKVVSSTPRLSGIQTHNFSGDRY